MRYSRPDSRLENASGSAHIHIGVVCGPFKARTHAGKTRQVRDRGKAAVREDSLQRIRVPDIAALEFKT